MIFKKSGLEEVMLGQLSELRMIIHVWRFQISNLFKDTKPIGNNNSVRRQAMCLQMVLTAERSSFLLHFFMGSEYLSIDNGRFQKPDA